MKRREHLGEQDGLIDVGHALYAINRFDTATPCAHAPCVVSQAEKPMTCSHAHYVRNVRPSGRGCEECVRRGDVWKQLRMCMQCGHVGCCDSSQNRHAVKHFRATRHPIARSIEPGEEWGWCYVDQLWFESLTLP